MIAPPAKASNIGDNDASPDNTPSQFLLFRGLEPSVTEELFAKGVAKLFKPGGSASTPSQPANKKSAKVASTTGDSNLGAREGTLRRILLVRDRKSNESWRYGFAEFATIDDAQAALVRYSSFERFTIASKQVLVTYIHAGVFVPVLNPTASTLRFTFSPLNNPAMKLAYWDEDAFVTELVVSAADVPSPVKSVKIPSADKEGLVSIKEAEKSKNRKAESAAAPTVKKSAPTHLQFWSNRHAELHGLDQRPVESNTSQNGKPRSEDPSPHSMLTQSETAVICARVSSQVQLKSTSMNDLVTCTIRISKIQHLFAKPRQNSRNTPQSRRKMHLSTEIERRSVVKSTASSTRKANRSVSNQSSQMNLKSRSSSPKELLYSVRWAILLDKVWVLRVKE